MRTLAQRPKASQRFATAASARAGALKREVARRSDTRAGGESDRTDVRFEVSPNSTHAFRQIPLLPPCRSTLTTAGSVRDQDARGALGGPDEDLAEAPDAEPMPEEQEVEPGVDREADPRREGDAEPSESETPAGDDAAKEGENNECTTASDHAGILALRDKAKAPKPKKTIAYGFTFWAAKGITYPTVKIDWTGSGNKTTGTVKKTTAGMGPVEALYLKPGTYKVPQNMTARGPACGKSGKKVPFFSKVGADISALAKQAEQEHCDDYKRAFELSYGKWAGTINSIAGTPFGPGSRKNVQGKIQQALKAKGDKGRKGWIKEAIRLKKLSLKRDQGDHSIKPDGAPVAVDAGCTRIDAVSVKGPNTNIPGPSTATLIK